MTRPTMPTQKLVENMMISATIALANSGSISIKKFCTRLVKLLTPVINTGLQFTTVVLTAGIKRHPIGQDAFNDFLGQITRQVDANFFTKKTLTKRDEYRQYLFGQQYRTNNA